VQGLGFGPGGEKFLQVRWHSPIRPSDA